MPEYNSCTGTTIYSYPDTFSDILLNDQSVVGLQLIEVGVNAGGTSSAGYGYVMCLREIDKPDIAPEKLIDGQYLTHTYHGEIQVIQ